MRTSEIIILFIIILSIAVSAYFYPEMPEQMASHWNASGEVDGYMPKFWGLFIMPIISFLMLLLFMAIPRIDPLKENIEKFRGYFDTFIVIIVVFLIYIHFLTISWSLGLRFDILQMMLPALALLFYYAGILIDNAKRNWFIGIRTPWTLSNENVWNRTHKRGGKLFKASAVIILFGVVFPGLAIYFILVPVLLATAYLIVYSYLEYQKETKK